MSGSDVTSESVIAVAKEQYANPTYALNPEAQAVWDEHSAVVLPWLEEQYNAGIDVDAILAVIKPNALQAVHIINNAIDTHA